VYKSRNWCKNICCKQTRCKKDRPVLSGFNNGQNILRYTLIISVIYIMYVQYHGRNVQDVVFNLESDITFNIINNSLPKKIEILAAVKRVGYFKVNNIGFCQGLSEKMFGPVCASTTSLRRQKLHFNIL